MTATRFPVTVLSGFLGVGDAAAEPPLDPGEPLMIVGETGLGKSLMAQALMGTLPPELEAKGRVATGTRVLNAGGPKGFRGRWGRETSVLPQEPWLSLDPLMCMQDPITQTRMTALLTETTERDFTARMLVSHDAALIRDTADPVLETEAPGTAAFCEAALPKCRVISALQ